MNTLSSLDIKEYDPYNDSVVIEGICYSGQLFRDGLGVKGLPEGKCFRLVKRNQGTVTIQTLPGVDELLSLLAHAVAEADGWHDADRGGQIQGDVKLDRARYILGLFKPTGESNDTLARKSGG